MRLLRGRAAGTAALALLAVAGCAGSSRTGAPSGTTTAVAPSTTQATPSEAAPTEPRSLSLTVYLLRGEKVAVASRSVPATRSVGAAALQALLAGPSDAEREAGLATSIPEETKLLGLSIAGGVAAVDLSSDFESRGGGLSLEARLAQVVYTLTQFPSVRAVRFELDGKPLTGLGGEGPVLDHPVGRAAYEDLTPAILVESPAGGDTVRSPLRISGTANTFEATFTATVADWDGRIVAEQTVTATSGSGTRGTFDATLAYRVGRPGRGALIVFERSAEDGSRRNVVEIPLHLR